MPWWNRYPLLNRKNGRKWCPVCRGFVKMLPIKYRCTGGCGRKLDTGPRGCTNHAMMDTFNRSKTVVFNTIQLYRHDRLAFLKDSCTKPPASVISCWLQAGQGRLYGKRESAADLGYPSPIQPDKTACDNDYNEAVAFCIQHIDPHIPYRSLA